MRSLDILSVLFLILSGINVAKFPHPNQIIALPFPSSVDGATVEDGPWSGVALNPLHLMRKFMWHDRPVRTEGGMVHIGDDSFPRDGLKLELQMGLKNQLGICLSELR